MGTDHIRYDLLVQDALRSVVRNVLTDVGKNGLPGDHHFYISFKTGAPGVRISNRLREQYPDEMTIVLQHQFWDLGITEHTFEVGLSFGGVPERLLVPFDSIVGFFDPSVQFGLKFEVQEPETVAENDDTKGAKAPEQSTGVVAPLAPPKAVGGLLKPTDKGRDHHGPEITQKPKSKKSAEKAKGETEAPAEQPTAAVVSLDAFRKKK
ncbi:MAG: SspB family protein [Beijerinckiaceae bacterium]